jgi:hypothetical protein
MKMQGRICGRQREWKEGEEEVFFFNGIGNGDIDGDCDSNNDGNDQLSFAS